MHSTILIAILALATALAGMALIRLSSMSGGLRGAEATIATTAFLISPALAFHMFGIGPTLLLIVIAAIICIAVRMFAFSVVQYRGACWAAGALLLFCLPHVGS